MSTPNKQLIAAIQRIAEGSPLFTEVRGLLKEIQRRGGIEGLSLKIGADDESGGDCCTDQNETGEPVEKESADITGDAPTDVSGGIGDDWTDCETGQSVNFSPWGFPQPETCKDCSRPDPQWQFGYVWTMISPPDDPCNYYASSPTGAMNKGWPGAVDGVNVTDIRVGDVTATDQSGTPTRYSIEAFYTALDVWQHIGSVVRLPCDGSPPCKAAFCTEEAPIIEDCQDWVPDSTTSYTLANGCIVASSCDPDASEQAKQCNECINICDSEGNQRTICTTESGGFSVTDPSGQFNGGVYNAQGQMIWQIPAGSTEF
jgi:hypothetical protein